MLEQKVKIKILSADIQAILAADKGKTLDYPLVLPSMETSLPSKSLTRKLSLSTSNVKVHSWTGRPCPRISCSSQTYDRLARFLSPR